MTVLVNGQPEVKVSVQRKPVILSNTAAQIKVSTSAGPGPQGPPGNPGVFVGPTPPSDTSLLWVDTSS